ncbi:6190_t:CDS:2, partial [Gigaspora margarita]
MLHLEANNIKESVTWSQLGYSARESWILDVCNKQILQIGSNKWIVEECLKQKLVDRKPLQQTNKHIEEHNSVNKENIFESNIELDENYQEDQENVIMNE